MLTLGGKPIENSNLCIQTMKCAIFWSPNTHCAFCFQLTTGFFTRRYVDNSRKVVVWTDHFARLLEQLPQSYFRGQEVCEKI